MLTSQEIQVIVALVDAGLKATGLQVFRSDSAAHLQAALVKLQAMADDAEQQPAAEPSPTP